MKQEIRLENYKVWCNEYDGKKKYSASFGSKKQDGNFDNAYMPLKFPRGFDYPNGTEITGKGFLGFTKYEGKTYWYIVVMEYEVVGNQQLDIDLSDTAFEQAYEDMPF